MKRGFYTIMAAQFFSSLADNALLIASIALLVQLEGPAWLTPLLKFFFTVSYVVLAAFVGAFADAMPKGKVMFVTNTVKMAGCALLFFHDLVSIPNLAPYWFVLAAYAVVGLGAAAYSPAKYGILTELLPPEQLVVANGWIEGLTVVSIVLGTVLGGILIGPAVSAKLLAFDFPYVDTGVDTPGRGRHPGDRRGLSRGRPLQPRHSRHRRALPAPGAQPDAPRRGLRALLHHALAGQAGPDLARGDHALLGGGRDAAVHRAQVGGAAPEAAACRRAPCCRASPPWASPWARCWPRASIPLKRAVVVLPVGIAMGFFVMTLIGVTWMPLVYALLILVGAMAGFFVVPMNALLQHRGHVLLSAGHSIAVQNFNENVSILVMLALYALMIKLDLHINAIIVMFGAFVAASMYLVMRWNAANHRADPHLDRLIGEPKH